jgi:cyclopropane-fatty-acyl-phospholipid synthase
MSATATSVAGATVGLLDRLLAHTPLQNVSIRLWDGTLWPDDRRRAATVVLKHPGALRSMLAPGHAKGLGEAYVHGDFDVEGDIEQAVELALALEHRPSGWLEALTNYYQLHRLPAVPRPLTDRARSTGHRTGALHSPERDRAAVAFHYDVSDDFYRLWLDPEMVYSCAYFETAETPLADAQLAKLRLLCRKLRLRPGQRLLDIGCGWGGLACHAARTCGVEVTGITLSLPQAKAAAARAREAQLDHRVRIELRDYREVRKPDDGFDAIVSVGMAEHVGRDQLAAYFATVRDLLKPGGVFLNHAIGEGRQADRFRGPSFVDAHVFPDSDIPPIPLVLQAAEAAGLEVRDVENLREHYVLTLRAWVRRLETARAQARALVGEETYRVWRLYMATAAHGFAHGDLAVYQTLLSKTGPDGRTGLPLTREDWYAD